MHEIRGDGVLVNPKLSRKGKSFWFQNLLKGYLWKDELDSGTNPLTIGVAC